MKSKILIVACLTYSASALTKLNQGSFDSGTYIISEPGDYVLEEDIQFRPKSVFNSNHPELWMFPDTTKPPYNARPYRLGFFAALVIAADDVTLDLGGYTIAQSQEHRMMQRFFSVIELASSPFIANAGPAAFAEKSDFRAAKNVVIKNGVIGLSSHHGIHGNDNKNVRLENLDITEFEVSGIHLNHIEQLVIKDVNVHHQSADVPVDGHLSNAIFLLQALDKYIVVDNKFDGGVTGNALSQSGAVLRKEVASYILDKKDPYGLFSITTKGLPDASMLAGIVIHSKFSVGPSLAKQPTEFSTNIALDDVRIHDLVSSPGEVGALFLKKATEADDNGDAISAYMSSKHSHDAIGAVFDIDKCAVQKNDTVQYDPNPLADAQLAFARYANACLAAGSGCSSANDKAQAALLKRSSITKSVTDWAAGHLSWADMMKNYQVEGNHDIMFHHTKGVFGLKMDGVAKVHAKNVFIYNIKNEAKRTRRSHWAVSTNSDYVYDGYNVRGISIAASVDVDLKAIGTSDIEATSSHPVCIDTLNDYDRVSVSNSGMQKSVEQKVEQIESNSISGQAITSSIRDALRQFFGQF